MGRPPPPRARERCRDREEGPPIHPVLEPLEPRILLTTYIVTSLADAVAVDGEITLREALEAANTDATVHDAPAGSGADTIQFAPELFGSGMATVALTGPQLDILDDVTLTGPGAEKLAIDAGGSSRVVEVQAGVTALMSGLTVTGGYTTGTQSSDYGGGIHNAGHLTLTDAAVVGNSTDSYRGAGIWNGGTLLVADSRIAENTGDTWGGGIANDGTLTVTRSLIADNTTIYDGGGIFNNGPLTVTNSTITGNTARSDGGVQAVGGEAVIVNTTIVGNRVQSGGAAGLAGGTQTLVHNSIIAGNTQANGTPAIDAGGNFRPGGTHNLIGILSAQNLDGEGTQFGTLANPLDAMVDVLGDNGGPTWTCALLPGSPAIDSGSAEAASDAGLITDQRGTGYPRVLGRGVDIGAYEFPAAGRESIGDFIWLDTNGDGIHDAGEYGIDGVAVRLYRDDGDERFEGGADDVLVDSATTAAGGYDFWALTEGDYWVEVDEASPALAGLACTTGEAVILVDLSRAEHHITADFGYGVPEDPEPEPIVVSTLIDENDGNHSDGSLSLREALSLADAAEGPDVIEFEPALSGGTITLAPGLGRLVVGSETEIRGPGADQLTIDADGQSGVFYVVNLTTAVFRDITITGGRRTGSGGGIEAGSHGKLSLYGVTVSDNWASDSGGGVFSGGVVEVYDSLISGNTVQYEDGGGIASVGIGDSLTVVNSSILANIAVDDGGGIASLDGDAFVAGTVIAGNQAGNGGGIRVLGGKQVIRGCTISGNTATNVGGGVMDNVGYTLITNSTISGNTANDRGGGVCAYGPMVFTACTITGNRAGTGGGGIWSIDGCGDPFLANTIVAGNTRSDGTTPDDGFGNFDTASSHNLIGAIDDSTGLDAASAQYGSRGAPLSAAIEDLGDNGGPTQTHALLPGSPAIDAGSNDAVVVNGELTTDQRGVGFGRIIGGKADVGAYEAWDPAGGASVGGLVWNDRSRDEIRETGSEDGIDALVVNLYRDDGDSAFEGEGDDVLIDSMITTNGGHDFWGLDAGSYWVEVDQTAMDEAGCKLAGGPSRVMVALSTDQHEFDVHFALYRPIVVSTVADEQDGDHSHGDLSLREALALAAAEPGLDVIEFDESIHYGTIILSEGLGQLTIDSDVDINGPRAGQLTVDADGNSRTFEISEDATARLAGLTITGGSVAEKGGGILSYGTLTLDGVEVSGNEATSGGSGGGVAHYGTVTILNSRISGNSASIGAGVWNGGGRSLTVADSEVSGNTASSFGGGIICWSSLGAVTITRSRISDNSASRGGGIEARGRVTVADSVIEGNSVPGSGGGVFHSGEAVTLVNTTVVGNSASKGGGIHSWAASGSVTTINCTIVENVAQNLGAGISREQGPVTLHNTIVAGNTTGGVPSDVKGDFESVSSHNLIGAIDGSTGLAGNNTQYGWAAAPLDAMLDVLGDNGGPTWTHALLPGSPAIDGGSNDRACDFGLDTDQRGGDNSRFVNGTVDIGAFEAPVVAGAGEGAIGDFVWNDRNADGIQDASEVGIDQVTLSLYLDDGDGIFEGGGDDERIAGRMTTEGGWYEFVNLLEGDYWVQADQACGALFGFKPSGDGQPQLVSLGEGEPYDGADFGYYDPFTVTVLDDELDGNETAGDLSLREALALAAEAPGYDVIDFDESLSGGTIELSLPLGQLTIDSDVVVFGPGSGQLTVDGVTNSRVLYASDGARAHLFDLTIAGGESNRGAGIYLTLAAAVTMNRVAMTANSASQKGGAAFVDFACSMSVTDSTIAGNYADNQGGGIYCEGTLTLRGVTISGNAVTSGQPGKGKGGGVYVSGTLAASNTTISGNEATFRGGGLYADTGTVDLVNVTVSDNLADSDDNGSGDGGGIFNEFATFSIHNTIVAANFLADRSTDDDVSGAFEPTSRNDLIGTGDGSTGLTDGAGGNQVGTDTAVLDAGLWPLGDYGGPARTHALRVDSTAIDAGDSTIATGAGLVVDQRGVARFIDHDGSGGPETDIGAYEAAAPIVVNGGLDEQTDSDGLLSLREALLAAAQAPGLDIIQFAPELAPGGEGTIGLRLGELVIDSFVDLQGPAGAMLTIDAEGTGRAFRVPAGVSAHTSNLTLAGGVEQDGAGISNSGDLTVHHVLLTGNEASGSGGAIHNDGAMTLVNTTLSGNTAAGDGGGVYTADGTLSAVNVTIYDNTANSGDAGGSGGGMFVQAGTVTLHNTIVAGNLSGAASPAPDDVAGTFDSASAYNLIGAIDGSTGLTAGLGTQYGSAASPVDPMLLGLAAGGGPTRTHGLQPASPVTDAGSNERATAAGATTDQRHLPRFRDGTDDGVARVDIGAFEQQYPLNQAPTLSQIATLGGAVEDTDFAITHEHLLASSDAQDPEGDPIEFLVEAVLAGELRLDGQPVVDGQTVLPTGGQLVWTPPAIDFGEDPSAMLGAFTVRAWDGLVASGTPVDVNIEVVTTAEPVNYAVLFSGGDKVAVNYAIYYENIREMYQVLLTHYGLDPHNIQVLYADGRDPAPDMRGEANSDMSFAQNVLPATGDNLRSTLVSLSTKIDANDHFFLWTFDHGLGSPNQPSVVGEEVLKGWGSGESISDDQLRVWLQGLSGGDDPQEFGVPADYSGVSAGFDTYVFAQCFSGGMLDDLDTGASTFGAASANHYEASYSDYFASAFTEALAHGYNSTHDAFQYALNHDGRAEGGQANGGDWSFNIEHPWATGGDFPIFAMVGELNASPELESILPLKIDSAEYEFDVTYDMLMAASDATDPSGQAIVFGIEAVGSGSLYRDGEPIDLLDPEDTALGYGDSVTWHRPVGSSGTLGAFSVTVRGDGGVPACDPVVVPIRIGPPAEGPVAVDDPLLLQENSVDALVDVLENDTGVALEAVSVGVASHGQVTLNRQTGQVRYTPAADYNGPDVFTYFISDAVNTDMGQVDIDVVAYDPSASGDFDVTYDVTELGPPPGWAGLLESWEWDYRQGVPEWTGTTGVDISDDGVVLVKTSRPTEPDGSIDYIGSTNAGYRWQSGDTAPFWNWEIVGDEEVWVSSTNAFMLLLETEYERDGREILHGVEATRIQNPSAMPAIRYLDPYNGNEVGFPSLGGVWYDVGTPDQLWQDVEQGFYPTDFAAGQTNDASYLALVNNGAPYAFPYRAEVWEMGPAGDTLIAELYGEAGIGRSCGEAINAHGHVVGYAESDAMDVFHAFFYDGTDMVDLGVLEWGDHSAALAVNANDRVVGVSASLLAHIEPLEGDYRVDREALQSGQAFAWSLAGGIEPLGTLSGGWSVAYDISDAGVIVGASDGHAVVWADGTMYDLNSLLADPSPSFTLTSATGINNGGQIIATGTVAGGGTRAYFLDVVSAIDAVDDSLGTTSTAAVSFNALENDVGDLTINDVAVTGLVGLLDWAADGAITFDPAGQFDHLDIGQSEQTSFAYSVTNGRGGEDVATVTITVTGAAELSTFHVREVRPTAWGFAAELSDDLDLSVLNLYDGIGGTAGPPDVTLNRSDGAAVSGSLLWDAAERTLCFIATGDSLAPDVYTATLAGRADGIAGDSDDPLDGDADDVPGGDFRYEFVVLPSDSRTVAMTDFARGPGQAVDIPATGVGLPITIDDAAGVQSVDLTLLYDPELLAMDSISVAPSLPGDWVLTANTTTPGEVVIGLQGLTDLSAGPAALAVVSAHVPESAEYGRAHAILIEDLLINETWPAIADAAIHKVAFVGDASGNARYFGLDPSLISRVVVGLDSGFDAYRLTDPRVVADVTGNGTLTSLDASYVARETIGGSLDREEIPPLPGVLPPIPPAGADPTLCIPSGVSAGPGEDALANVAVSDDAAGILSALIEVEYDTTVFDVAPPDITLGDLLSGLGGTSLLAFVDEPGGTIRALVNATEPLAAGTGDLLDVAMHTRWEATGGRTPLHFDGAQSYLNGGRLALTLVDGEVIVAADGDCNFDGRVDFIDYLEFKRNVGTSTGATWETGDFNHDGKVGRDDFVLLSADPGQSSGGAASPAAAVQTQSEKMDDERSPMDSLAAGKPTRDRVDLNVPTTDGSDPYASGLSGPAGSGNRSRAKTDPCLLDVLLLVRPTSVTVPQAERLAVRPSSIEPNLNFMTSTTLFPGEAEHLRPAHRIESHHSTFSDPIPPLERPVDIVAPEGIHVPNPVPRVESTLTERLDRMSVISPLW